MKEVSIYLGMIGIALAALLLGGWLPGGTYWLTPVASGALVVLAFFGRQSPLLLVGLLDGEWRAVGRVARAHWAARVGRLVLLAAPVWVGQMGALVGTSWAVRPAPLVQTALEQPPAVGDSWRAISPVRVWAESATASRGRYDSVRATIVTTNARLSLPAQALYDGWWFGFSPAVSVGWGWTDLDLLPDVAITVNPVYSAPKASRIRTLYVPLTDTTIHEQSAQASWVWGMFVFTYPILAAALLARATFLVVAGWLHRWLNPRVSQTS